MEQYGASWRVKVKLSVIQDEVPQSYVKLGIDYVYQCDARVSNDALVERSAGVAGRHNELSDIADASLLDGDNGGQHNSGV